MEHTRKHIILVAGEASGDLHASHLVHEIRKIDPEITFSGLGGPRMEATGVKLYYDLTQLAVIGFFEVIKHYREIKRIFHLILEKIDETQADAVILVDYPGFNLRLAKELKKRNKKVIYYISPQVWAWKKKRVYYAEKYTDKMLVLFQFEKEFYAKFGIHVECVGHPLLDIIRPRTSRTDTLAKYNLDDNKLTIGLFPGSREKEIERHLPIMVQTVNILFKDFPHIQCLVGKASTITRPTIVHHLQGISAPVATIDDNAYEAMNASDVCIVSSGTATLETAILEKPMVIIYKTSFLTWLLAKIFIKIPHVGLVNVVAGNRIVPECIQFGATPQRIAKELKEIITNEIKIASIKTELQRVKNTLGHPGASVRAAQEVLKMLP